MNRSRTTSKRSKNPPRRDPPLHELIRETVPDAEPNLRSGMVGYGEFHYATRRAARATADLISLSSRKKNYISLYVLCMFEGGYLAEALPPSGCRKRTSQELCALQAHERRRPRGRARADRGSRADRAGAEDQ